MAQGFAHTYSNFESLPNISIDYALLEKLEHIAVVPMTAPWSDVGTWDSLHNSLPRDTAGETLTLGDSVHSAEGANTLVWNTEAKPVITLGIENAVVINTPDGLLVASHNAIAHLPEMLKQL